MNHIKSRDDHLEALLYLRMFLKRVWDQVKNKHLDEYVDPRTTLQSEGPSGKSSHSIELTQTGGCARINVYQHRVSKLWGIGLDDILDPIDDPDNLLIYHVMFRTSDVGLLGADLPALIHSCDPTQLGAQILL